MDKMIGPDYEKGLIDTHLQNGGYIEDHGVIDYGGLFVSPSTTPENISMTMENMRPITI